ncbi:hypothetical protein AZ66_21900 [Paenibacillus sp. E194]|uniref:hypothetical protein n=1 Tax=Paenibacillus sp. E194 TaxID=1458845 RepID=UPI0005CAF9CF|nr:hypothetical protein [Paenibacillus sp. E194]KJB85911.1 hypothetical protein AZ66_21900 [Paenibacillus sp. E194]
MTSRRQKDSAAEHLEAHDSRNQYNRHHLVEDTSVVGSFVVRCRVRQETEGLDDWRIRITYVQGQEEQTVASWEEAVGYMQLMMKRGNDVYERERNE